MKEGMPVFIKINEYNEVLEVIEMLNGKLNKAEEVMKKINELKKELKKLESSLQEKRNEQSQRGGPMDSWHEAASFAATDGTLEQKVSDLKGIIKATKELSDKSKSAFATLGSFIKLKCNETISIYRLVHPIEADPSSGLVSVESPFGKALIGKKVGDTVIFKEKMYKIVHL